jgi:hypothetical protein
MSHKHSQKKKIKTKPVAPEPRSSLSFSLSRWFRKLTENAPSTLLVTVLGVSYTLFLFGGGLYSLITQPAASGYYNGQFFFLYPNISNQYMSDTLISIILYALGFVGLMSIYQSTKNVNKPRQAYMLLIAGVAFLLISYLFLEGAILFKTTYNG